MAIVNLLSASGLLLAFGLYRLARLIVTELNSPIRQLPGPKSNSLVFGNFKQLWAPNNIVLWESWVSEFGRTFRFNGFFGITRFYTADTKAMNHILMNTDVYTKPPEGRFFLARMLGEGVLVVEGDKHTHQRKIMNPAFGAAQIRELTEIFIEKSLQLRDIWSAEISKSIDGGKPPKIEVLSGLSKMTLDVIGLAGFNYNFNALNPEGKVNELSKALEVVLRPPKAMDVYSILQAFFPILRPIPTIRGNNMMMAKNTMLRIGNELMQSSKASARSEKHGLGEKSSPRPRDLLSLLIKANLATDVPDSQRLSDDDVLAQIPTFLVAGHETTSTGTTWALFALAQDKRIQDKLRNELLTVSTDNPTMDELNALPYLDYVIRETMRFHAPVPASGRRAEKDDLLPLGTPCIDRRGKVLHHVKIRKGDYLTIPILLVNRSKDLWGEDAHEFKPERWESVPDAVASIPGIWGNMLTFLGGPRACIGFRFTLTEMKSLLFTLVRAFEFDLALPADKIGKTPAIVQRPMILGDPEGGNQMPLLIKPYQFS